MPHPKPGGGGKRAAALAFGEGGKLGLLSGGGGDGEESVVEEFEGPVDAFLGPVVGEEAAEDGDVEVGRLLDLVAPVRRVHQPTPATRLPPPPPSPPRTRTGPRSRLDGVGGSMLFFGRSMPIKTEDFRGLPPWVLPATVEH